MMTQTDAHAKRSELLSLASDAKKIGDQSLAQWCSTFAANFALIASDKEDEHERGIRTLEQNKDWFERLFVAPRLSRG